MAKLILAEEGSKPQAPSAGSLEFYAKTDDNLYIQNSAGVETMLNIPATGVTSVGLLDGSTASIYNISGSPVTSTGTLTFSLVNQNQNLIFAGPSSGSAAQPTFRSLTAADLPAISLSSGVIGTLSVANGGTGQTSNSAAFNALSPITATGDLIIGTGANTASNLAIGLANYVLTSNGTTASWQPVSGSGTVTSVALSDGSTTPIYTVSGSPVTGSGTITETLINQSANTIFAGPTTGSASQPSFRALVANDIPSLSSSYVTTVNGSSGAITLNAISQLTGDVTTSAASGSQSEASTVAKIQGVSVGTPTGTGNVVFSASPTFTGTILSANNTMSGTLIVPTVEGAASGGTLLVQGGTAASNGNGGNLNLYGAAGSNVSTGGNGGTVAISGGNANGSGGSNQSGGAVNLTAGSSIGSGTGGTITLQCGTGGTGTGSAGATGGTVNVIGGTGGAGSSTSGNGGGATLKAGSGGGGVAGGQGGTAQITGGTGGTGSSTGGNGGPANVQGGSPGSVAGASGGSVTIAAGQGSSTGTGGAGGSVTISTGQANGDNSTNYGGGSLTLSVGKSYGSSGGSNITMTAGTGGIGTSTTGANGGNTTINAGNGGAGSSTGGTGGNIILAAGTGGNSTTPGSGGYISFQPASTTSTSEVLRVTATNVYTTNAPLTINTPGFGLQIKHGSNCKLGTSTLSAGSVTVANTAVTANSIIFLTVQASGGTMGFLSVGTKTVGTSFVINSSSSTDTSTVAWMIVEGI